MCKRCQKLEYDLEVYKERAEHYKLLYESSKRLYESSKRLIATYKEMPWLLNPKPKIKYKVKKISIAKQFNPKEIQV